MTDCICISHRCCTVQVAEAMLARRRRLRRFETRSAAVKKRSDPVVRFQAFAKQAGIQTATTTTAAATISDSSANGSSADSGSITLAPPATVQQQQQQQRRSHVSATNAVYQLASTGGSETESANGYTASGYTASGYTALPLQRPLQRAWGTPDTADTASQFDVHTTAAQQAAASSVKSSSIGRGRARGAMLHAQTFDLDRSAAVLERERTAQRHE
jgi:hypothetical protein